MAKSKHNDNGKRIFFAAVTKNCKTAIESSKKAVIEKITRGGATKKNVVVFKCCSNGINVSKELTDKRKFPLMARHRTALKKACTNFLEGRMEA